MKIIVNRVALNGEIGSALRKLRVGAGLTQAELAGRLGAPQSLVSKIETGERSLHACELFFYAQELGVSATDLVALLERSLREAGHLRPPVKAPKARRRR